MLHSCPHLENRSARRDVERPGELRLAGYGRLRLPLGIGVEEQLAQLALRRRIDDGPQQARQSLPSWSSSSG